MIEHSTKILNPRKGRTLYVSLCLLEIIPDVKTSTYSETILYSRVKVEEVNQDILRKTFMMVNDKYPSVVDFENYYIYQYCNKPPIYISQTDGRIYGEKDDHLTRLQAIFCLQKLNKFGLVEGFKRVQKHPRNQVVPFLEEVEKRR